MSPPRKMFRLICEKSGVLPLTGAHPRNIPKLMKMLTAVKVCLRVKDGIVFHEPIGYPFQSIDSYLPCMI